MARPRKDDQEEPKKRPPAKTPQARENELINLAFDEAERQISEGKASSQMITHFLKLGSAKEGLERQELESKNKLLIARVEQLAASANSAETYERAIQAFRGYRGEDTEEEYYD